MFTLTATNKSGLDYVVQHRPSHAVDQLSTIYYSILVFLVLFVLMSSTARMMVKQVVVWPQRALIGKWELVTGPSPLVGKKLNR